ncbi:MAG: hypothetical protein QFX31_05240 [Methanothrix sp.]|uniref:hypothetical protein n=1 Tax=Methanothrix sp. TaxID=90426 RepID=UPI0032B01413|nr:hypothetical protein [Methanothrix sp.]
MRSLLALLSVLLFIQGPAISQQVDDIFSSIDSCDVTVSGDTSGCYLQADLMRSGVILSSRVLPLDAPGTLMISWNLSDPDEGAYAACASVTRNGTVLGRRCYSFYHGGEVPVRFDVRDFLADSSGIHMVIYAADPAIVDIYYMLISGNKAVYVYRDRSVKIAGGRGVPTLVEWKWPVLLNAGETYTGRAKMVELTTGQTRAFMNRFVALENARITETYEDEMGASATVLGTSRVPFRGSLRFVLYNGTEVEVVEKRTPVLLEGDDETVEISWNRTLDPGIYHLKVMLLNSSGAVVDLRESVIEAEPVVRRVSNESTPSKSSPSASVLTGLIAIFSIRQILRRCDRKR